MRIALLIFLLPALSQATLTPSVQRGDSLVSLAGAEICVIPTHPAMASYSDKDRAAETALCSMIEDSSVAVCAKLKSTNPGVEFFEVAPGQTADSVERGGCAEPNAKKVAKYKNSISCSYTPAILAYYHVSRILGGAGRVPPAVLRTLDVRRHMELAQDGIAYATQKLGGDSVIVKTWNSLLSNLQAGPASSKKDLLFTDDFSQSYGALQVNPRGEVFYKAMFNQASAGGTRADAFRDRNAIFAFVKSPAPLSTLVGVGFSAAHVQTLQQMKDASDLTVIDTLLSQEDRFGNIAAEPRYAYLTTAGVKFDSKLTPQDVAAKKSVLINQMVLKDNDCGVSRSNVALKSGLLALVRHMDPRTYQGVLAFDAAADQPETVREFRSGMMFTSGDYSTMRSNLHAIAASLKQRCNAGALKLDLDMDSYFAGRASTAGCELAPPHINLDTSALGDDTKVVQ